MVTETRQINGVSRVELSIDANLTIQQGTQESLTVTADDNILPVLVTNVVGGKLNIRYLPQVNIRGIHQPKLTLTVKKLDGLQLSSSGTVKVGPLNTGNFDLDLSSSCDVELQGFQSDKLTANISSSGDVTIQGVANSLVLHVSSSGNFTAGDLKVNSATVTLSSSGDITLWVVDNLNVDISSSGNVSYYGNPIIRQHLTSSGNLIAKGQK